MFLGITTARSDRVCRDNLPWLFAASEHFEDRGLTLSLCSIVTQKRKVGTIAPKKFIARLRKEKIEFDNYMQQVPEQIVEVLE